MYSFSYVMCANTIGLTYCLLNSCSNKTINRGRIHNQCAIDLMSDALFYGHTGQG